ncbi:low molecular weight protein tyrosine phosphatase family protein [Pseudomonas sp. P2757]|uniref:low molecular weight protein tyrosine phosphatase family protein n=1 Tax=unclassified Pseudomonas TaxID=196821 RepID=UPI003B5947CA
MLKVLFICSQNRLRSPTAERRFADWAGVETASAGVNLDADVPVSSELLQWADLICVMEPMHRQKLSARFRSDLANKHIVCLHIPDEYDYMEPALIKLLEESVIRYLPT